MTGLTAPPDNYNPAGIDVAADGFYPSVSTEHVRDRIRLGEGAVTNERLIAAIEGGMISAMRALDDWRKAREGEGAATLQDASTLTLNGQPLAVLLWNRAVTFYAAADLADMHVDVSATDEAIDRDEEKRDTADVYRRKAYDAIADLRAIGAQSDEELSAASRNRVDLI